MTARTWDRISTVLFVAGFTASPLPAIGWEFEQEWIFTGGWIAFLFFICGGLIAVHEAMLAQLKAALEAERRTS